MHTLIPGEWYLLFACEKCETLQVLFPDLSKGQANINGASYIVACQQCGHKGNYDAGAIERYQHPLKSRAARIA
jgi:RNase P subunit RPR2